MVQMIHLHVFCALALVSNRTDDFLSEHTKPRVTSLQMAINHVLASDICCNINMHRMRKSVSVYTCCLVFYKHIKVSRELTALILHNNLNVCSYVGMTKNL